jgi:hypothetical protein
MVLLRIAEHASWKRDFPDYATEFLEIFGTVTPTITAVSEWKTDWENNTSYNMEIPATDRGKIRVATERLGIHPYYWGIYWSNALRTPFDNTGVNTRIQFYSEELLVMFKLTWANE